MNSDFAVIKTTSGQYIVKEGDIINLDLDDLAVNDKVKFDVLLISKDGKEKIGNPLVPKIKVEGTVIGNIQAKKITILTFKAKSRYRRHKGHRQQYTQVRIDSI